MFSEGRVSQKRSRFACKMYGGVRRGIETLTLTHDHIPIYPVYNSRFPCVPAKGCVPDFPLGRGGGECTSFSRFPSQWEAVVGKFGSSCILYGPLVFCMGAKSGFVLAGITLESRVFFSFFWAGGRPKRSRFLPIQNTNGSIQNTWATKLTNETASH